MSGRPQFGKPLRMPSRSRSRAGAGEAAPLRYVAEHAWAGYGEAADRLVRAVRGLGVDVAVRGWSGGDHGAAPALVPFPGDHDPRRQAADGATTVVHLVPEHSPLVREVVGDGSFVAHTVWETDRLPAHWPALLNATDTVIVPNEWNREVFVDSGVTVPVAVVGHVACDPVPGDRGARLALPDDVVVFYTIGRWDTRKALDLAVEAFLRAFRSSDPVVLVVKTGTTIDSVPDPTFLPDHPLASTVGWQVAALVRHHADPLRCGSRPTRGPVPRSRAPPTWRRVRGPAPRGGVGPRRVRRCAYGNPVVMTGWGGQLAYLDPATSWLVDSRLVPVVHPQPASYTPDQRWAAPDLDHAVQQLRAVYADVAAARERAAPQRERVLREFAPDRVARTFLAALGIEPPPPEKS
ncbi:MAG: hypothetical protein U0W40_17020 [Acidimicrobiia bacterium]